jgi:hypothetical protein
MIQANLSGRLGNHMFQYAICRIIADRNNFNFKIAAIGEDNPPYAEDTNHHIFTYFPELERGIVDGSIKHIYHEDWSQSYNPSIFNIPDYTKLYGYFQTEKYFVGFEDSIKNWFKVNKDQTTLELLKKYPIDEYCYVHFRCYVFGEGQTHISLKFYLDAYEKIKQVNTNIKLLIITEDINFTKNIFKDIDCEIISNDMMIDYKLLYFSKYCIISPSTFSWWAAWLTDKEITIAPQFWINYDSPEKGWYPSEIKTKKFTYV